MEDTIFRSECHPCTLSKEEEILPVVEQMTSKRKRPVVKVKLPAKPRQQLGERQGQIVMAMNGSTLSRSLRSRRPVGTSLAIPTKLIKTHIRSHRTCVDNKASICSPCATVMASTVTKCRATSRLRCRRSWSSICKTIRTSWTTIRRSSSKRGFLVTSEMLSRISTRV